MGQVERGVVKGSNRKAPAATSGTTVFCRSAAGPARFTRPTRRWAATAARARSRWPPAAPASRRPNHKFDVGMVQMPQPASAIEPGKGTVPVNPFLPGGAAAARVAGQVADEAKPK